MTFLNMKCEDLFDSMEDESIDIIASDPPFNASEDEVTGGEKSIKGFKDRKAIRRDFGKWDRNYDPVPFLENAQRVLVPGGWLVIFSGDRTFGIYHYVIHQLPGLYYKASLSWTKTNGPLRIRKVNFLSATEWIVVACKGKRKGDGYEKVPPIAWNWLGQRNMKNWINGPISGSPERLYWHLINGKVIPCFQPRSCVICKEKGLDDRRNHPTQKPFYLWEWFYKRLTVPGMTVFDPYSGVGTSGIAAKRYGLLWTGTEINPEFHEAGMLLHSGKWKISAGADEYEQSTLWEE